jgi:hypothetical protein
MGEYEDMAEKIALLKPCDHTGFESVSCEICGYPDSRKLIAKLKADLIYWEELASERVACNIENTSLKAEIHELTLCLQSVLEERPYNDAGDYIHHAFCSGDRQKPPGAPGCVCMKKKYALQAKLSRLTALIESDEAADKAIYISPGYWVVRRGAVNDYRAILREEIKK